MSGFTLLKGNCPVCGGSRNDCRQSNETELVFCRDEQANPTDYIFRGTDSWGFGLWQHTDDAENFKNQAREEWQQQQRQRQQEAERQRQLKIGCQLAAGDRDIHYRRLLTKLNFLHPTDRDDLLRRGFTPEQIEADGYKSVEQWQKIAQMGLPANLPGVLPGDTMNTQPGYLCPLRDVWEQIVGFQGRKRNSSGHRYYWLTSATSNNPDGATPHLHGELPIAVFYPEKFTGDAIWLTEGTGAKPSLTRYRLGVPVLGAAGGQFAGSPNTVRRSLEHISGKYSTKKIIVAPDAGDVNNSHVMKRWESQLCFLEKLGYEIWVAWWGQCTKKHQDIDELEDKNQIEFITPTDFLNLAAPKGFAPGSGANKDGENPNPPASVLEHEEEGNNWAQKNWEKSRRFTPDIVLNQAKFSFPEIPDSNAIIAVKSGLGTGKTEAMIAIMQQAKQGAHIIGYRNNLLFQTIDRAAEAKLGICHIREGDAALMLADDCSNQAFCLDSIHRADGYFKGRDIWLDESCSVLLHAVNGGTLKDGQAKAIKILSRSLKDCNRVFMLDGNLSNLYVDFVAKLAPNKRVIKIENQHKIPPHNIQFIEGIDLDGEIKKRDKSPLLRILMSPDVVPWIGCDTLRQTKVLDEIMKAEGKEGYCLNSETTNEEWARKLLENPTAFIDKSRPDYLIISPTGESGISAVSDHFTHKFTFFAGILNTNSQHQIMFRLRNNLPHYVFCPERSMVRDRSNPSTYSQKKYEEICNTRILQSALLASTDSGNIQRATEIISAAISRNDDNWWDFSVTLGALDNFEMDNLRKCLIHALEEVGHQVEIVQMDVDEGLREQEKAARELVQSQHAKELYMATEFPSLDEAKEASKKNPNKDAQRRIEKTYLLDRIPGIKETDVWSEEFVLKHWVKDKDFINRQIRFWLLNHFEVSQKRHEVDWYYKATQSDFFKGRMKRISHLQVWALKQLDVSPFMTGEYHKDSPAVIDFVDKARSQPEITNALGFHPKNPRVDGRERMAFVTGCLNHIGLKIKSQGRKLCADGIRRRFYSIDTDAMKSPERLTVLECIERKQIQWMESEKSQVNWEPQESQPTAEIQEIQQLTPLEQLIEQLEKITDSLQLQPILQKYSLQDFEDALLYQSREQKQRLIGWREEYRSNWVTSVQDTVKLIQQAAEIGVETVLDLVKETAQCFGRLSGNFKAAVWGALTVEEKAEFKELLGSA